VALLSDCSLPESGRLDGLVGGAVVIPALALTLGVWIGSSKAFEVIYVLWWYLGPLHSSEMPALDFMGISTSDYGPAYLLLSAILVLLAVIGRGRQIQGRQPVPAHLTS
jgi:hypothetical protein